MFANEKDVILETIRLAEEREAAREAYEAQNGPKKWGVYLPEEKALNDYLMTLDRDAVEVLEVLMLLGRDNEYRKDDKAPEENYLSLKNAILNMVRTGQTEGVIRVTNYNGHVEAALSEAA